MKKENPMDIETNQFGTQETCDVGTPTKLYKTIPTWFQLNFDESTRTARGMKKITFFSDSKLLDSEDEKGSCSYVQQYDLSSKCWMPMQTVPVSKVSNFSMCQEGDYIRMIGGELGVRAVSMRYNMKQNLIEFDGFTNFITKRGANLMSFKNNLYFIGGRRMQNKSATVYYTDSFNEWRQAAGLKTARSSSVVLTSMQYMYVIGGTNDQKLHIECNSFRDGEGTAWEQVFSPVYSVDLHERSFFVLKNKLCCLYTRGKHLVYAAYSHERKKWKYVKLCYEGLTVDHVCQFSYNKTLIPSVYVYANSKHSRSVTSSWVPNYVFSYNGLQERWGARGKCEIDLNDTFQVVYTNRI